ncbi:hypothetical protein BDV28DRAFT_151018 [Aspergillus coremiiformis]|uniref:Uncharacterized protein n=1 Tax=Aspergillus coremiiformis TaxID=138285 RepID=A0A5N6Z080_9EURO|nr:hypothetical protein BDV28DRAFT_151018 [Aspergillus coremiiformis]
MNTLDTLATDQDWVHGSKTKPFTAIVTQYMNQQIAQDRAVQEIASAVYGADGSDLGTVSHPLWCGFFGFEDGCLEDVWSTIIHTARKIPREVPHEPPDVPTVLQLRLAALLLALKRQPDPSSMPAVRLQSSGDSRRDFSWRRLPLFEETVLKALDDEPGRRAGFTRVETEGWGNLMAFLALVTKERIVGLESIGLGIVRWALEERHDSVARASTEAGGGGHKGDEATRLNVFVAAAAIWAVVMGEELWERMGEKAESPVGLSLGPVPKQLIGTISKRRWEKWIGRFQFLSLCEDLKICTRELAAEAAAVMLRVG